MLSQVFAYMDFYSACQSYQYDFSHLTNRQSLSNLFGLFVFRNTNKSISIGFTREAVIHHSLPSSSPFTIYLSFTDLIRDTVLRCTCWTQTITKLSPASSEGTIKTKEIYSKLFKSFQERMNMKNERKHLSRVLLTFS